LCSEGVERINDSPVLNRQVYRSLCGYGAGHRKVIFIVFTKKLIFGNVAIDGNVQSLPSAVRSTPEDQRTLVGAMDSLQGRAMSKILQYLKEPRNALNVHEVR
jgi:hypothetical protein